MRIGPVMIRFWWSAIQVPQAQRLVAAELTRVAAVDAPDGRGGQRSWRPGAVGSARASRGRSTRDRRAGRAGKPGSPARDAVADAGARRRSGRWAGPVCSAQRMRHDGVHSASAPMGRGHMLGRGRRTAIIAVRVRRDPPALAGGSRVVVVYPTAETAGVWSSWRRADGRRLVVEISPDGPVFPRQ